MATTPVGSTDNSPASSVFASLNGTKASASNTSATDDAQNRFLKLLTTQLKNQDPMNPLDNAQMTSQLAQISTVSGIEKLNTTLQSLINNSSESQTLQAAALVGHGVLVPGSGMKLSNGGGQGGFELAGAADKVTVDIKDANGLLVRTLNMGEQKAGVVPFAWDGKTDAGAVAADGAYTFSVTATQGKDKVTADRLTLGLVQGVTRGGQGLGIDVGTLGKFGMADIKQIL